MAVETASAPCGSMTVYWKVSISVWLLPSPSKAGSGFPVSGSIGSYSKVPSLLIVTVTPVVGLTISPATTSRLSWSLVSGSVSLASKPEAASSTLKALPLKAENFSALATGISFVPVTVMVTVASFDTAPMASRMV